ncbi:MAG TPA: oligosaccharide flippase family protein [Miltoncostaeaceae bacterium]|nr:oligosaccharide flippase family protein [Miltoncostaeaceae bacterium]
MALSTVSNYAGQATILLTWFFLTPFLLDQLGSDVYALFVLATALMGYGSLLDLGLTSSVVRFVAELHARGETAALRDTVATGFVLSTLLGVATFAAGAVVAPLAPVLFAVPDDQRAVTTQLVLLTAVSAGLVFPTGTLFAVLRGLQRFDLVNAVSIVATLLTAAATVVALLLGGGVLWVVGVGIPISIAMQVPAYLAVRRAAPGLRLGQGRPRRHLVGRLVSFGWAVLVVQGASQIKTRTDEIVIAVFLPVARVTPYALARRVAEAPQILTYQFVRVLMPLSAELGARDERDRLRRVLLTGTRLTLVAYLLLGTGVMALAGPFLAAWVGEEFRSAGVIMVLLVLAGVVDTAVWPAASVLQGISRHRPLALFAVVGALLNLGVSVVLIHPYGPTGVALGTLVAATVETLVLVVPYALRVAEVSVTALLREAVWPALLPAVPAAAAALGLRAALAPESLLAVLAVGAAAGAVYVVVFLATPGAATERDILVRAMLRRRRRHP